MRERSSRKEMDVPAAVGRRGENGSSDRYQRQSQIEPADSHRYQISGAPILQENAE